MSGGEHEEAGKGHLILETLIAIIILLLYTISGPIFEKYHFHYMHESGMCMIIGVVITFFAMFFSPNSNISQSLKFNDEMFFTFILPPIIFAAGYNLRRRSFFKYFLYIFIFGVLGTIITFIVVTPLTYIANQNDFFYFTVFNNKTIGIIENSTFSNNENNLGDNSSIHLLPDAYAEVIYNNSTELSDVEDKSEKENDAQLKFSIKEILLFASVISATDSVAALTFVKEDSDPKLFAILFGEGVVNDAVCIVLYRILRDFTNSNEGSH